VIDSRVSGDESSMSGSAKGDNSGLIDLDTLMKEAALLDADQKRAQRDTVRPPSVAPAAPAKADDSLSVSAVTTDRPAPSVSGLSPVMKAMPDERAAPAARRRSGARTAAAIGVAALLLAAAAIGVVRVRASSSSARVPLATTQALATTSAPAATSTPGSAPVSEPASTSAPASAPASTIAFVPASASARASATSPASSPAASLELHTLDLPPSDSRSLDLGGAMKSAVNATDDVAGGASDPSGGSKARQIRPSPGAVLGALNGVLPAARACLSPDEAMRSGTVVFASSGTVSRVDLNGSKPSDGCIKGAISRARIEPFAEDSFTTRITVRP
jgi:hypothetical protein